MRYAATRAHSGSAASALKIVEETLLPNGFRIVEAGASRLELKGPGMRSSKENPLRGATRVVVDAHDGVLHLDASLGGVVWLSLFVCLFPPALWLILGLAALARPESGEGLLASKSLYGVGIWLVLGPAMSFWFRKRTIDALETMLINAAIGSGRN